MLAYRVVVGDVVAVFKYGLVQAREAAAIEQFGFEAALQRFGGGASHHKRPAQGFADQVFRPGLAHAPAPDFTRAVVQPHGQVEPASLPG
ncbi:hypothetical protein [Hymenobacter gelipurpurascens]|uniref:hypothetical protein n=1 Tax=Hymenobacter gelipurpurascens TaxID=89968 RepID=UPI0014824A8E|nr:hypothetical protein [Hymenobacter gelipurpurascens]